MTLEDTLDEEDAFEDKVRLEQVLRKQTLLLSLSRFKSQFFCLRKSYLTTFVPYLTS